MLLKKKTVDWQVRACRKCVQTLEPVWPDLKKLKESLNDVASRAKEAMIPNPSGKKRKSSAYKDKQRETYITSFSRSSVSIVNRLTCPAAR